jgi:hypothetical protein
MKPYLAIAGVLLAVLNGLLLLPKAAAYAVPIAAAGVVLAVLVVVLSLSGSARARETAPPVVPEPPPPAPAIVQPPVPAAHRAEAEVVAFVALLQQGGRFVDFLMEDLTSYSDEEVGAAARVVHQGCRQVLQDNFKVIPIADAAEGSEVTPWPRRCTCRTRKNSLKTRCACPGRKTAADRLSVTLPGPTAR